MGRLSNLPEEITIEILSRVPTESVLDCKLVCKPFRDLIRQPSFAERHLDRLNDYTGSDDSRNKGRFIFFNNSVERKEELYYTKCDEGNCDEMLLCRKKRINLSPAIQNYSFLGSFNGLICFSSWYDVDEFLFGPAYVANPITREYVILPDMNGVYQWTGFGYSSSTNQYKVVRICLDLDNPNHGTAQVYTLGSGNGWKNVGKLGMKWKKMEDVLICAGAFANGALHWVNRDNGAILAFHLTDEKFSELPSPPCLTRDGVPAFPPHLGVLGEFLSATYYRDANCSEVWLWKKNKDKSDYWSWSKEFTVNTYIEGSFEFMKSCRLLGYRRGDIYIYDPKTSSVKIVMDSDDVSIGDAIPHKNTLVSLRALGEKDTKTMEFRERATSSASKKSLALADLL